MTINTESTKRIYVGNGTTTDFDYDFKIFVDTDLRVTLIDAAGNETVQVLNTDYTVTGEGFEAGGKVKFTSAPAAGVTVLIQSDVPYTQPTDFKNQGRFFPETHENAFDRAARQALQVREKVERSLTIPGYIQGVSTNIPAPSALHVLGWNANGDGIRNYSITDISTASGFQNWTFDVFTAAAGQTIFPLQKDPVVIQNTFVTIDGVAQVPGIAYSLVNSSIVFNTGLSAGRVVLVRYGVVLPASSDDPFLRADLAQPSGAAMVGYSGGGTVEAAISVLKAGQTAGMLGYATRAAMDADLAHPDGTLALVTNDGTASNNGTYRKSGASGTGSWVLSADRVTSLEARATRLEAARAANQADLLGDNFAPFFVNTWGYTKSFTTGSVFTEASIVSRDSDTQLTVETGAGARFPTRSAVAILDGTTGRTKSYAVKSQAGDVLQFFETLPANPTKCQPMHDGTNGQHLSRLGYKGLADYVVDQVQKYAYKKDDVLFEYHPPITKGLAYNNPDVYALDGVTKLVDMTAVGGAAGGGFVTGTTNLPKLLSASAANENIATDSPSGYYPRGYILQDGVAGRGFYFTFPVNGRDGFLEIPIAGRSISYVSSVDGLTYSTAGQYRVEVIGDGSTVIHDQTYNSGQLKFLMIDFTGVDSIMVRVTLTQNVPTSVFLGGCYAYSKSPATSKNAFFKDGDVIAFFGDSWTQFPLKEGAEVLPLRADGSTADGMCFLSERMRERLAADGITVTTQNMGKGGTTTEWGKYWISKILELSPRPTHCVINFGINDLNSISSYTSNPNADSAWDFDPANMWAFKYKSAGGKQGMVNADIWFANLKYMCNRLLAAGIKPIVMMPPHTASASQAQAIRDYLLARIGAGFRDTYTLGGGT